MSGKKSREMLQPFTRAAQENRSNYPFDHWWVAALASEVEPGKLLARQILGKSIVFYRTGDGRVAALENRCPHRAAPLSLGDVIGDNISCRYHGFQFAPDGKCVHIPTQNLIPPAAAVRSYPVREIGALIWVWTGEISAARDVEPSAFDWLVDAEWLHVSGYMPLAANYMSLKENVLDLTHFGFVHASTFKIKGWIKPPSVTVANGIVRYETRFAEVPLPHMDARMAGTGNRPCDVVSWGSSISPAMHEAGMDARLLRPERGERTNFTWRILHITTPQSPRHTHYWWVLGADYGQSLPGVRAWLTDSVTQAFVEDKLVLEAIQAAIDDDSDYASGTEISVEADKSGLQARRVLYDALQADAVKHAKAVE